MSLTNLVFSKKNIFYFLLIVITIGGIMSYQRLSKLEDPEIVVMIAKVVTVYPGASAHEVEMQVTNVLEEEISTLADLEAVNSQSSANVSVIDVELKMTVPQDEIAQRWEFLRRKIQNATAKLPQGAQTPMVIDDIGDVYGMFYGMTAPGFSYKEMADQADFIKSNLLQVDGVRKVAVYGNQPVEVEVVLLPEKMATMGVLPVQIIAAINDRNSAVYPGVVETGQNQLRVTVDSKFNSVNDLENMLIKGVNQEIFKLSDIAVINKTNSLPLHNTMFVNNQKALGISVSMESGENIIDLGKRVDARLEELKLQMPAGYEFTKVFFQPDKVETAISDFMWNLLLSLGTVVIVLMITMGLRSGLIIGVGLLFTVLATFPILLITDGTLQRISLGAFIVAMGMLVDNAIVVIDGIIVNLKTGKRRKKSFLEPANRTALPLLGATIIAIAAFLPAYLSKDTAGTYVHDLFMVLCISLFVSWILALTQVPLFSMLFLKVDKLGKKGDPYQGIMFKLVKKALNFMMQHKIPTVIIATVLLLLSAYNFKNVKQTFFPDFNYNQAYVEYKLPYGTNADKVNTDLRQITDYLLSFEQVKMVVTSQGMTPTRYCLVRPIGETIDNYGELIINFEDYETMIEMKPRIEKYIHDNYPDAISRIRKYNLSIKSTHTVEVQFSGPDPAVLRNLSKQVEQIMHQSQYANKYTIGNDWAPMGKIMVAQYNVHAAQLTGTTRSDVSNALLMATNGLPLGKIYEGETPLTIKLKMLDSDTANRVNLQNIPVWNMLPNISIINQNKIAGLMYGTTSVDELRDELLSAVPLSAVTNSLNVEWEEQVVRRANGRRTIQAECDPIDGYSPALLRADIRKKVENIELPEGYSRKWVGEYELQGMALRNIFSYLPVSLMIIIFVLILLFNDFKRPAIVMMCIPLAIIGIVPGLIITGQPFTFMAIIGTIGLIGMLVKNSIVLLDEIEKQIKEGVPRYQAVINATISRTRPVIMASLTTILGMMTLLTDPMYQSMAVTVISGLIVGTIITLIFVPILYSVIYNVKSNEVEPSLKQIE